MISTKIHYGITKRTSVHYLNFPSYFFYLNITYSLSEKKWCITTERTNSEYRTDHGLWSVVIVFEVLYKKGTSPIVMISIYSFILAQQIMSLLHHLGYRKLL